MRHTPDDEFERGTVPKLTPTQQQEWRASIERIRERHAAMLLQRGRELWSPSWELLNEARDTRTQHLS